MMMMNTPSPPGSVVTAYSHSPREEEEEEEEMVVQQQKQRRQQQQQESVAGCSVSLDFTKRDRFDRAATAARCREVIDKLKKKGNHLPSRIARTRFLGLPFDVIDLPDVGMMLKLFTELRKLSAAVAVSHGGYLRATYDTRKFKEMAHAAVRNFLRKAPLSDVMAFADAFEPGLSREGFARLEEKTLEVLSSLLKLATKSAEPFLLLLYDFLTSSRNPVSTVEEEGEEEEEEEPPPPPPLPPTTPPAAMSTGLDPYFTCSPGEGIWRPLFYNPE